MIEANPTRCGLAAQPRPHTTTYRSDVRIYSQWRVLLMRETIEILQHQELQRWDVNKLRYSIELSPEAVEVLRALLYGESEDRSPSARKMLRAFDEHDLDHKSRKALLVILGLEEE